MTAQAIILHGVCSENEYMEMNFPSPSNAHWLPWLQQKFLRNGTLCQKLEMPKPYNPNYNDWASTFEQLNTNSNTTVVAHSAGCGFILKYLTRHSFMKLDKLVLVAPWVDPTKRQGEFLQEKLSENIINRVNQLDILYSSDDDDDILTSVDILKKIYPQAKIRSFDNMGHFCEKDLIDNKFPELWEISK